MSTTREEALQIIWERCQHSKETEEALEVLKAERPHGEWIFKHNSAYIWCSNCDEDFDAMPQMFLFCPNCGADMREGDPDDRT